MKQDLDIFRRKARGLWLLLWKKDIFIFLLFVGLTSIFWWGHVMSSSRDMDIKIPIVYTGISDEVVVHQDLPNTLALVVRDEGKRLRQLSRQDIQIKLNLSEFIQSTKDEVMLTTDILRPRLQDLLPGSTHIQQITPEEISFTYHTQHSKVVPIVIQADIHVAPQYQLVGEVELSHDSVQIFGSKEEIENITYVLTDSIIVRDLRDSIRLSSKLIVPENTRILPEHISLLWRAEQFTEKSFLLPIKVLGLPKGEKIRLFPSKAEVTVRVGISNYSELQAKDIQLVCTYPENDSPSLPLQAKTNKPYIYNIRITPSSVEYIIER